MSDNPDTVKTRRKVGITFARKLSDGNYGGTEASAWVEGDVDLDASAATVAEALANLFTAAKAAVLDELGIEWHIDEETGLVRESVTPFVSAPAAAAAVERTMPGATTQVRIMNAGKPGVSTEPIPDWLPAACARDGVTGVWDQRATATGNQPWFKEAVPRGGSGHGKDGQAKGYWPPK